ncbi:hypothetical protein HYC85_025635 [Camellia sinensis]|uniref:GST N-terminal domain-containing protein n=1 Tax=Camellia sinensis TaxID=4442 RepID=A0A7J7GBK1_CAMSI|nr:hypothetical protein HYC85_025635 [Camellia sinensis]
MEEILEIQRDGINLRSSVSISYLDAILGTVVKSHPGPKMARQTLQGGFTPDQASKEAFLTRSFRLFSISKLSGFCAVKTVEGTTDLQIPSGTQPGDVLVLAKKGAPKDAIQGLQEKIKLVPIDLQNGPDWYKEKVYPPNKVPSLEHNNEIRGESLDLLKYIDSYFEGPALYPDSVSNVCRIPPSENLLRSCYPTQTPLIWL